MGFDAKWGVLGAADVGAPHQRDRIWISGWRDIFPYTELFRLGWWEQQSESVEKSNVANTKNSEWRGGQFCKPAQTIGTSRDNKFSGGGKDVANSTIIGLQGQGEFKQPVYSAQDRNRKASQFVDVRKSSFWTVEPDVGRVADGVAARVDRLKAIGNGQVSEVARRAWEILSEKR
jgi:DNA (cytosine-5)-methyltransferase 1